MLLIFQLENIVDFLNRSNPEFLKHESSAMLHLLLILNHRLNTEYALPTEVDGGLLADLPHHWDNRHNFIMGRDILPLLNLLREACYAGYTVKLKVIGEWLFGIELTWS